MLVIIPSGKAMSISRPVRTREQETNAKKPPPKLMIANFVRSPCFKTSGCEESTFSLMGEFSKISPPIRLLLTNIFALTVNRVALNRTSTLSPVSANSVLRSISPR